MWRSARKKLEEKQTLYEQANVCETYVEGIIITLTENLGTDKVNGNQVNEKNKQKYYLPY